ncbi:MAG: right-handed parallel beta-helix repeat-containing protein, partial [Acidimicrobiales bacterium]
ATPTNGTLSLPSGCLFRESVTISRSMTVNGYGDVIDGRDTSGNVVRSSWMTINASNVTVAGFTMQYANDGKQVGALVVGAGQTNVSMLNLDVSHSTAGVSFGTATNSSLIGSSLHDNAQEGVHLGGDGVSGHGVGNAVRQSKIFNNNLADQYSPEDEAGGLKATVQTNLVLDGNDVYNNHGPGMWCDIYCHGTTYSNNRVHDNTYAGIMEEVSYNGRITGNAAWNNGFGKNAWGWGAGILVSSSTGTVVDHNTVAWNARSGISILSQNRSDWPAVKPLAGIYVHDNVTAVNVPNTYGEFWAEDFSGTLFATSQNNRGAGERYWFSYAENGNWRFAGNGNFGYLSDFAKTAQATGSTYVTTAQMTSLLSAAGIPTSP